MNYHVKLKGGQDKINYWIAKYMAEKGHEVHIFSITCAPDLLDYPNVFYHPIKVRWERPAFLREIIFARLTDRKRIGFNLDIIHVNGGTSFSFHHVNHVHLCHGEYIKRMKVESLKQMYYWATTLINAWIEREILRKKAVFIVSPSRMVKEALVKRYGLSSDRIRVIYNGIDTDVFTPPDKKERERARRYFGISEEEFVIAMVGDVRRRMKGIEIGIEVFKTLGDKKMRLLIAGGSGKEREKNIFYAGFVRNIRKVYYASDVLLFPSLHDAFGLVVLEAMACGIPAIVSPRAGVSEILKHGQDALLLNTLNTEEIREKLLLLYQNPSLIKKLGKNARKKAERYSWRRMGEEFEKFYLEILRGG